MVETFQDRPNKLNFTNLRAFEIMNQAVTLPIDFVPCDTIRSQFSNAMSQMYRTEVPAYGALIDLVDSNNQQVLTTNSELAERLGQVENLETLSEQRHGAIRIGKASELAMMGRIFAIMGMLFMIKKKK